MKQNKATNVMKTTRSSISMSPTESRLRKMTQHLSARYLSKKLMSVMSSKQ